MGFGDSNTYGYDPCVTFGGRYPAEERWVDILAADTGWETLNYGENGREIPRHSAALSRFSELLAEKKPDLVIIMLGGNDLLQGASPETAAQRMKKLLLSAPVEKSQILLMGPLPVARGAWVETDQRVADSVKLAELCRDVARQMGVHYADARNWGVAVCHDGVHFTAKGHQVFAREIRQVIEKIMPETP